MYLQQPFALVLLENTAREILFQISYVKTPSINKAWQSEGYPFQLFFFLKYIYFVLAWKHSREILSENKYGRVLFRPHFSPGNFIPHLPNSPKNHKAQPKLWLQPTFTDFAAEVLEISLHTNDHQELSQSTLHWRIPGEILWHKSHLCCDPAVGCNHCIVFVLWVQTIVVSLHSINIPSNTKYLQTKSILY